MFEGTLQNRYDIFVTNVSKLIYVPTILHSEKCFPRIIFIDVRNLHQLEFNFRCTKLLVKFSNFFHDLLDLFFCFGKYGFKRIVVQNNKSCPINDKWSNKRKMVHNYISYYLKI